MSFKKVLLALLILSAYLGTAPVVEAARPEVPPGHAMYIVMLHDVTTMPHPADRPRPNGRKKPDIERIGGRVVEDLDDSLVITLPEAAIERVKNDPAVRSVQRVWLGERIDSKPKTAPFRQETLATETVSGGKVTWFSGSYAYDPSGNVKTIGTDSYGYDSAGRLIKTVLNGKTETYGYDAYGNLISKTTDNLNRPFPAVDPGTNRLSGYVYDVAGNLTAFGTAKYEFDALNMITVLGSAISVKQRFIYTPDDERIGIVSLPDGYARWRIRDFQNRVIREFTGRADNVWRWDEDYVYSEGRIVAGERFATQGVFTQYHTDHLGSVRLITNQNGARIVSKEYYPFGEEQTPVRDELTYYNHQRASPMKFTGHERDYLWTLDDKSEYLDYMHARQYNPIFGRFLSVDPVLDVKRALSEPQRWNRYSYVVNNPINRIDPDGRADLKSELASIASGFLPGLGEVQDASIALTGFDPITAEQQSGSARVFSAAALGLPFVGGKALSEGASLLAKNFAEGNAFQNAVTGALGATRNSGGVSDIASRVTTIPDLMGGRFGIAEIKNVKNLSSSPQLRAQFSAAQSAGTAFSLVVSNRTRTISGPVQDLIRQTGGKIFIFDPKTEKFRQAVIEGNRIIN